MRGNQATARAGATPTWSNRREALQVILHRPHLRRTMFCALIVGTLIFVINQLDVVLEHHATGVTYLKGAITYLVPFCVANFGVLTASRSRR